jgi:PAS domain S-box-containing protein
MRFDVPDPLLQTTLEAIGEAVIITTPDLDRPGPTILYVNPAFTRLTGYTPEEAISRSPRLLQGPETDRAVLDRLTSDLLTAGRFEGEAVNYRKDGTSYTIEWHITAMRDRNGQPTHWIAVQRDITDRRRAEEHNRLLLAELQHRVRNILAVVRFVARRSAEMSRTTEDYLMHFDGRIDAIARAQALVTWDPAKGVDLELLVAEELLAYRAQEGEQVEISGPSITLQPRAAETLGLAIHELATNALKYGALARADGRITVNWQIIPDGVGHMLRFEWREAGGPVLNASHRGFGTELLEKALARALGARTELSFTDGRASCTIEVPPTSWVASADNRVAALVESGW